MQYFLILSAFSFLGLSSFSEAAVSLNGPDAICRMYLAFGKQEADVTLPDLSFARQLVSRHRASIPRSDRAAFLEAVADSSRDDVTVLAFINYSQVLQALDLVPREYLEVNHQQHHKARNSVELSMVTIGSALSLGIWGALNKLGISLDSVLPQSVQFLGIGAANYYLFSPLIKRMFGESYRSFLYSVASELGRPTGKALTWGSHFRSSRRRSRFTIRMLFTYSSVPVMPERDVFSELPDTTPVLLVVIENHYLPMSFD
jgi:hypothetical protein